MPGEELVDSLSDESREVDSMLRTILVPALIAACVLEATAQPLEVPAYQTTEEGKSLLLVPLPVYRSLLHPPSVQIEEKIPRLIPDLPVRVEMKGEIRARRAEVSLKLSFDLGNAKAREIPLLDMADNTVITSFAGPGELSVVPDPSGAGTIALLLTSETGPVTVDLKLFVSAVREGQGWSVTLPWTEAPQQSAELTLTGEADAAVTAQGGLVVASDRKGQDRFVKIVGLKQKGFKLHWEAPVIQSSVVLPEALGPAEQDWEPELSVQAASLVTVAPSYLKARSNLAIQVRRHPIRELTLAASAGLSLVHIEGPEVSEWVSNVKGELQYARVLLKRSIQDKIDLQVEYEVHPVSHVAGSKRGAGEQSSTASGQKGSAIDEAETRPMSFMPIHVPDAYQEEHFLGISKPPNIELAIEPPEPWRELDHARLPPSLAALTGQTLARLLHCERFPKARNEGPPRAISIPIKRLDDVQLLQATIDVADALTALTEDGHLLGRITYRVQNNSQQFLTLVPPKGSQPLTIYVAGKAVRAASDTSSRWLIPLGKSGRVATGAAPFDVEVTYYQQLDKLEADRPIRLELPSTDLGVSTLRWSVDLPKEWTLQPIGGNVQPDPRPRQVVFASDRASEATKAPAALFDESTLPLAIELPPRRETFYFSADLIDKDADARSVEFSIHRSMPAMTRRAIAFLVGVLIFYVILRRRPEGWARATATAVSLVGTGILMALFGWASTNLGLWLHLALGLFMGTVIFGLSRLAVCVDLPAE